jgi:hypothetical protein
MATNKLKFIGKSHNGVSVAYEPIYSHAATHFEDTPQLEKLVAEVIKDLNLTGESVTKHFDMGRIIGTCDVVDVDESDEIVYGQRKNRASDGLVPFTKSRKGSPCQYVAVQLLPQSKDLYILASAWIGTFDPKEDQPFPNSPDATSESISYWDTHAFVYGSQEIVPGTQTPIRPW